MPTAFPKSPIRRIGPPGPMSRVHSSMQTGKLLRLLGQIYRSRARQTCKSCMRLHKRELRLGRGRRGKRFFTAGWLAGLDGRLGRSAGCLDSCRAVMQRKCLPSLACCARVPACLPLLRPIHLALSGCRRRANPLARGIETAGRMRWC